MATNPRNDDVWIVIAAYNESSVIAATIEGVRSHFGNVVVVDDHSTDTTGEIALNCGAHVCRHPVNLGQGASLATGIAYALRRDANFIVTFDADGQHSALDANRMVERLREGSCDVVLGSRFLGSAEGMSDRKRLFLKLAVAFTRMTSRGMKITDTHNGLRALNRKAALSIKIRHNRMAHASEILSEIQRCGLSYEEAPCTITYTDYSKAKGQRMSGAITILADLALGRLHR